MIEVPGAETVMPDSPDIYFQLANCLLRNRRLDESIESFQEAVKLKPDYAEANANLGAALLGAAELGGNRAPEGDVSLAARPRGRPAQPRENDA
jgi:tetratricopeptide (TPR) repeat protein